MELACFKPKRTFGLLFFLEDLFYQRTSKRLPPLRVSTSSKMDRVPKIFTEHLFSIRPFCGKIRIEHIRGGVLVKERFRKIGAGLIWRRMELSMKFILNLYMRCRRCKINKERPLTRSGGHENRIKI